MDKENYQEYVKLKYNDNYFENNYIIVDGIIFRKPISGEESQAEKSVCLSQCFKHFTKDNIDEASYSFEIVLHKHLGLQTRCCCSQEEEFGLRYKIIKHKETGLEFVIGRNCFENLFESHKLKYFFQPNCKYCSEKVKRDKAATKGFCGLECHKKFNDREEQIRKKKEWDDGAPEREAKRIARLAEIEEEEKKKQEIKKKFPYGIWNNCQRCNRENKSYFQKKYKICENCCKN